MTLCLFSSDLHGSIHRYRLLLQQVAELRPAAVLLGGDLLPSGFARREDPQGNREEFFPGFLAPKLRALRSRLGPDYPPILLILGNDDLRSEEDSLREGETEGLWHNVHGRRYELGDISFFGYAYVPPTPFLWKDWERYDVSRYVPPGSVSPEEGWRTVDLPVHDVRYGTIREDLEELAGNEDLTRSVFLFHTPPYQTKLDRAALDGKMVDHVPLDLHVGSIAVRRFIEARQPLLSLHGHIHESARLTGSWRDRIGRTHLFTGAHDGPELALIAFELEKLEAATRTLL